MIKDNMRISGFKDFYERKDILAARYMFLSPDDKMVYKWYIYSRRYIREKLCDAMWEYLNAVTIEELSDANTRLMQGYAKYRCEVNDDKYY